MKRVKISLVVNIFTELQLLSPLQVSFLQIEETVSFPSVITIPEIKLAIWLRKASEYGCYEKKVMIGNLLVFTQVLFSN